MRALMLVLPYHSENLSQENLQNVFTKPPLTKLIDDNKKRPAQKIVKAPSNQAINGRPKLTTFRPLFVPNKTTPSSKYHSQYVDENAPKPQIGNNVQEILASIGLFPNQGIVKEFNDLTKRTTKAFRGSTTPSPAFNDSAPDVGPELQKLLAAYGLLDEQNGSIGLEPLPVFNEKSPPVIADFLKSPKLEVEEFNDFTEPEKFQLSLSPKMNAQDYTKFKRLPTDEEDVDAELEDLLKKFGLMDEESSRKRKSMTSEKDKVTQKVTTTTRPTKMSIMKDMPSLDPGYFNSDQTSVLDNIGISMRKREKEGRKINSFSKSNIFKPASKSKSDEEDFKKLEQLLETIRELDKLNANLTSDELERLNLKNYNLSETLLAKGGPDPISLGSGDLSLKNEIKRQQPTDDDPTKLSLEISELESGNESLNEDDGNSTLLSSSLEIISTTKTEPKNNIIQVDTSTSEPDEDDFKLELDPETTTKSSTTSTTEEARNKLEDEIDPVDEEPLPAPRRNGFYFLADWNSFLEVGEDPDKIVVRFDPKVGDPSRFIKVTVP